jgi:Zn ribbon nucleic-acid-binding protein
MSTEPSDQSLADVTCPRCREDAPRILLEEAGVVHLRCDACGCRWHEVRRLRGLARRVPKRADLKPPPDISPMAADRRCPECRHKGALIMLQGAVSLHLRCESCGCVWREPERRRRKRDAQA